jgi:hypothetical protein
VEEVLKVCESHPESLVGKSPIRDVDDVEENSCDDESGVEARGRSERVRGLGIERGSTITGASPTSVEGGEKGVADNGFLSFSLSLSLIPRNLLAFRVLEMGIEDCGNSGDGGAAEVRLARVVRLPAGSVTNLGPSRFDCF